MTYGNIKKRRPRHRISTRLVSVLVLLFVFLSMPALYAAVRKRPMMTSSEVEVWHKVTSHIRSGDRAFLMSFFEMTGGDEK